MLIYLGVNSQLFISIENMDITSEKVSSGPKKTDVTPIVIESSSSDEEESTDLSMKSEREKGR